MRWYDHLYVGEKAKRRRAAIIRGIREQKLQPEVYVITPPENGDNILDIYPAPMLLLPPYRDEDKLILGIAVTYWQALSVTRQMIDDMYRMTGGFDLAVFLQCGRQRPGGPGDESPSGAEGIRD